MAKPKAGIQVFSVSAVKHSQKQLKEERVCLDFQLQRDKSPCHTASGKAKWRDAAGHIFIHKQGGRERTGSGARLHDTLVRQEVENSFSGTFH